MFPADLTADGEADAVVDRVTDRFGRLDTLVNAAGVMLVGPAIDAPLDEWHRNVDLNLAALLSLTHAALPVLAEAARSSTRGVADIVAYVVTRPRHVAVGELLVRPTQQV